MVAAVQKKKPARSRTPATSLRISFLLRSKCHANAAHHAAITEKRTTTANIAASVNATDSATGKADERAFAVIIRAAARIAHLARNCAHRSAISKQSNGSHAPISVLTKVIA
jgi:hypothetical protein